jgi:hypothetical protein
MSKQSGQQEVSQVTPLKYPKELAPFIRAAPLPVLVRSTLEWMLPQAMLEQLFEQTAQDQYTRELTLTFLVDLMLDVACGIQPSALKAFNARSTRLAVSRQALYGKLRRMEPGVSAAVVQQFAALAEQVIEQLGSRHAEPVPGYHARVVDGTVLGGRGEHRIKPLRELWSAGLTGLALAVYAPAQRVVRQVVLAEDAYAGERALLDQLQVEYRWRPGKFGLRIAIFAGAPSCSVCTGQSRCLWCAGMAGLVRSTKSNRCIVPRAVHKARWNIGCGWKIPSVTNG